MRLGEGGLADRLPWPRKGKDEIERDGDDSAA